MVSGSVVNCVQFKTKTTTKTTLEPGERRKKVSYLKRPTDDTIVVTPFPVFLSVLILR